jgi:hypothetical protein
LRVINVVVDDILHQLGKDWENISDLRAIPRMVFKSLAQCISHRLQNIFWQIAWVTEDEFIPKQQLAKFEKPSKIHNEGSVVAISNLRLTKFSLVVSSGVQLCRQGRLWNFQPSRLDLCPWWSTDPSNPSRMLQTLEYPEDSRRWQALADLPPILQMTYIGVSELAISPMRVVKSVFGWPVSSAMLSRTTCLPMLDRSGMPT